MCKRKHKKTTEKTYEQRLKDNILKFGTINVATLRGKEEDPFGHYPTFYTLMSVGRKKSFQYVKIMLPLFRAVVKFCSTNRLFKRRGDGRVNEIETTECARFVRNKNERMR